MPKLYGKTYTKHDLLQRVGDISQLGGVERFQLHEGLEQGVEGVRFRTGTGLSFDVLLSRGMDISTTEYQGVPLVWRSPTGRVAPTYYDPRNTGWLRSFHGGMSVTCGLTSVGSPSEDSGEELGLHGRISNIPASNTHVGGCWQDDDYLMWAEGQMKQAVVFGENLILHRRVEAKLG